MPKLFAQASAVKMSMAIAAMFASSLTFAEPLKVCSDPDNLPFSKSDGPVKGLYVDLAELVGKQLGVQVEYVWYLTFNQRRAIRNTMDRCDAYFALPSNSDYKVAGAERTKPFLDVRYAVVSKPGTKISGMADLKGMRVGVTHGSPMQIFFAVNEGYQARPYRDAKEIIAAIEAGEVDAGVVWGPQIGFLNQTQYSNYWKLTPVSGAGMGGKVSVAVPKGKEALKEKIEAALTELQPEIEKLQDKYGFPKGTPLIVDGGDPTSATHAGVAVSANHAVKKSSGNDQPQIIKATYVGLGDATNFRAYLRKVNDGDVEEYRKVFNSRCSHCHSQNGASPQPERDLRRLSGRYGEKWRDVARTTITNGRPEFGMPPWGESLTKPEIDNLLKFLETIQKKAAGA